MRQQGSFSPCHRRAVSLILMCLCRLIVFPVSDFQAAAEIFLQNRPSQTTEALAAGGGVESAASDNTYRMAELSADQIMNIVKQVHTHHLEEAGGAAPSLVSDGADSDLDFLKEHLKAVEERLKSAKGQHLASLKEERDRTMAIIRDIAEMKRRNDVAAAHKKLEDEKKRLALMTKIRQKICVQGRCPMDFAWRWEGNGFRCEGGSHYATAEQLGVDVQDCIDNFSKTGVVDV
jgi:hypothetical protein